MRMRSIKRWPARIANTHEEGTEIKFRSATYVVAPDGSYRRVGEKKLSKSARKALKRKH